jgi:hypothetical protein
MRIINIDTPTCPLPTNTNVPKHCLSGPEVILIKIFNFCWKIANKLIYIGVYVESRGFCLASPPDIFFISKLIIHRYTHMAASNKYKCTQTHSKFIWYVLLTYNKYISSNTLLVILFQLHLCTDKKKLSIMY